MRLVNAGHDYSMILRFWTLPMVLKALDAMKVQENVDRRAAAKAKADNAKR